MGFVPMSFLWCQILAVGARKEKCVYGGRMMEKMGDGNGAIWSLSLSLMLNI